MVHFVSPVSTMVGTVLPRRDLNLFKGSLVCASCFMFREDYMEVHFFSPLGTLFVCSIFTVLLDNCVFRNKRRGCRNVDTGWL
jgi:hypothetical protein